MWQRRWALSGGAHFARAGIESVSNLGMLGLHFIARSYFMLEQHIADAEDRSDFQDGASLDALVVDKGSIGRIEVGNAKLVGRQFDQAVSP